MNRKRSKFRRRVEENGKLAGAILGLLAVAFIALVPTLLMLAAAWWLVTH